VGDRHDGGAEARVGGLDQLDHVAGRPRVELAGRLVRQQQPRAVGQRDRDAQPLLLAS